MSPPLTTYPAITSFEPTVPVPVQSLPLLPATTPPLPEQLPLLPSRPRRPDPVVDSLYELTTHLVPAAYPRFTPFVPSAQQPEWSPDRETWKANVDKTTEEVMHWKYDQHAGKVSGGLQGQGSTKLLWNCVNRYTRRELLPQDGSNNTGLPLTLFFSHANGFPKEIWEPTLRHLVAVNGASDSPLNIAEIWSFEAVNHGDAALVNGKNLGGMYDWGDQARDISQFLAYYLPPSPNTPSNALPVHLPRQDETLGESRKTSGFQQRNLVVIGHSFSGAASTIAAANYPALFSSLILVDPVLRPLRPDVPVFTFQAHISRALNAIKRRAHWPSREEALKQFQATPFWQAWDSEALDRYVECGLCDDPKGGVKLKMSGMLEAIVFAEAVRTYEAWQLCPLMDTKIPLKFIMPGKNELHETLFKHEMVKLRPANSSHTVVTEAGHLITQERPKELAQAINTSLREQYMPLESPSSKL
ncbi:Alpha/Beta hydrolase protein [Irpex rosettiformis]|uniref:Alpha/Beta hydrolase protein n=1 Tax=Irpex rosettiformis TaxID=378272 RepID=A0ACB8TZJ9_9APHY|nr:Alpha/Beta hydrolase protein [Irpex rosettiformis]